MTIFDILSSIPHNPHYLHRYIKFVSNLICQPREKYKTEKHHICPESLFLQYSDLRKNKWNAVNLTHRQHFVAHWLLWKAFPSPKMTHAFWAMCNWKRENKPSSRAYQLLKEARANQLSSWLSENNPMHNKDSAAKLRIPKSQSHKDNISNANLGKHSKPIHSAEQKLKYSEMISGSNNPMFGKSAVKGRSWFNNGATNIYLKPTDPIPPGFTKGRLTGWNTHP